MCLTKVTKVYGWFKGFFVRGIGYKFYDMEDDGRLRASYITARARYKLNEWATAKMEDGFVFSGEKLLRADDGASYPKGFHIYTSLDEVKKILAYLECGICCDVLVKVKYRRGLCLGFQQNDSKVIIAKKIKPLEILMDSEGLIEFQEE